MKKILPIIVFFLPLIVIFILFKEFFPKNQSDIYSSRTYQDGFETGYRVAAHFVTKAFLETNVWLKPLIITNNAVVKNALFVDEAPPSVSIDMHDSGLSANSGYCLIHDCQFYVGQLSSEDVEDYKLLGNSTVMIR